MHRIKTLWLNPATGVILFLYIATANLIAHSGSIVAVLFTVLGLMRIVGNFSGKVATRPEKAVLTAFALYSAVYVISFLYNGLHEDITRFSLRYIDDESKMLMIIPIFYLFRVNRIQNGIIWNGAITGAILSGGYALICFGLGISERISGSYDAIAFGNLSLVFAALSVISYGELTKSHRIYRFLIPLAFCLGITGSILSGSRGGWVAIPALFLILLIFMLNFMDKKHCLFCLTFCCFFMVAVYLIPQTNFANRVKSAVSETADYFRGEVRYGGATVRLLGLQASMNIFLEHPILGAGPGNYKPLVDQKIAKGELHKMTAVHSQPASTFLSTLAACGTMGLLALMGLFLAPCWFAYKVMKNDSAYRGIGFAMIVLAVSFFHFGLFETIFRRSLFTSFYVILMASLLTMSSQMRQLLGASAKLQNS